MVITNFCNLSINTSPKHLLSSLCYQIAKQYHSNSAPKQGPSFYLATDPGDPTCATDPRDYKSNHHEHATTTNTVPCPHHKGSISDIIKPDISLSELKEVLSSLLTLLPSPTQSLVLVLDGLDQIENHFNLQIIRCLPSPLPPGVKLILTVSSNRTHLLQAIKLHYSQCSPPRCVSEESEKESGYVCVQMGLPDRRVCVKMLTSLLSSSHRKVTSGQQALVNQALTSCCLTLFTRLLHGHTLLWQSGMSHTVNLI